MNRIASLSREKKSFTNTNSITNLKSNENKSKFIKKCNKNNTTTIET